MHECPEEVVKAGQALMKARRSAAKLEGEVLDALAKVRGATKHMVDHHDALDMQSGEAEKLLLELVAALPNVKVAHNSLQAPMHDCNVKTPTNEQLKSIR